MEIEKNKEYIVDIIDNGYEGEGIAKIDNFAIFIPNAIKGEKVKILIVKVLKNYAYGKIIEIIEPSENREENIDCTTYKRCGGCSLRHIKYEETLNIKRENVVNCLKKALNKEIKVNQTIGMDKPLHYRNKLQYPIGINAEGNAQMGVFANRTHTIIPTTECKIQNEECQKIANEIFNFIQENKIPVYNEKTLKGSLRHIVIKIGIRTNEIMVVLVSNTEKIKCEDELVKHIIKNFLNVKTIVKNINSKNTNVILGQKNIVLYGNGYIQDILGEYKFNISPMSFYQVNPVQTEVLYNTAIKMAQLNKDKTVFDLYCGIGTISLFLSKHVKKVYGIEIVNEAIDDAIENAKLNNVSNVEFVCGDVEKVLPTILKKETPDVVFVDPPRKGLDEVSINNILTVEPKQIVYISCNPATLARDLHLFEEKYDIVEIQPIDMFPYSYHVECVAVLKLKQSIEK